MRFRKTFGGCLAAALAIFLLTGAAHAAPQAVPPSSEPSFDARTEAFHQSAEALYRAAVAGDPARTRRYLRETEEKLRSLPLQRVETAEGMEALARSVARFKRMVARVNARPDDWEAPAAEIRLAADALAHPDASLWHRYRAVLREDAEALAHSTGGERLAPDSLAHLKRLQEHYGLIRTSVLLRAQPYTVERADSVLHYAERILTAPSPDIRRARELMPSVKESMEGLFPDDGRHQSAAAVPVNGPPWGWSAAFGSFIVMILSWVGWLRYRRIDPVTPRGSLPPERRERR